MNPDNNNSHKFIQFETRTENAQFEEVYDIEPTELLKKIQAGGALSATPLMELCLIDVREANEFTGELGHIAGTVLISLGTIPQKIEEISRDKTVVFICRSGGRSAQATAFAKSRGFESVYNMRGGMLLWNQLALPTE